VPVAAITDADPYKVEKVGDDEQWVALYPAPGETIDPSDTAKAMKTSEDEFVKIFYGVKTFEYDFALHEKNRTAMLAALKEIHPRIGPTVEAAVANETSDAGKAKALFSGMFEREDSNVQKGRFAQALAAKIEDEKFEIVVPDYIEVAIKHACS
jgi:putative ATP-dependent endonuclease of the OLD family